MNKKVKELFKSLSGSEICGILSILFYFSCCHICITIIRGGDF